MLQSDDRCKHGLCCWRWIQKSPQFQTNIINSFDLNKVLHQNSFSDLVSIEPVLHCTRNTRLSNTIPMRIWILSPNETHFSVMRDGELEVLFDFVSSLFCFLVCLWCWRILVNPFKWWVHMLLMNVIRIFSLFLVSYRHWRNPRFTATWWLVNSSLFSTLLESFSFTLFWFHRCFSHHDSTR